MLDQLVKSGLKIVLFDRIHQLTFHLHYQYTLLALLSDLLKVGFFWYLIRDRPNQLVCMVFYELI